MDLGRSGSYGSVRTPPREESDEERRRRQGAASR
jgi:hypothetical protein